MNRLSFRLHYLRFFITSFTVLTCTFLTGQVPSITSFSPESGPVGTTVTITGMNFGPQSTEKIVWFGAVRGTVTSASDTGLNVTVPSGATYQPVKVTVNGLTAYASKPFNVTFSGTRVVDASSFAGKIDFPAGSEPYSSVVSDLDGDNKPDLIFVNRESDNVSIIRNRTDMFPWSGSSFELRWNMETGIYPSCVAVDDIDGDGKKDIVVANSVSNTVSIFRNTSTPGSFGPGSFAPRVDFSTGGSPQSVAIDDIDGDGKPDLAVTNYSSSSVSILRNTSTEGTIDAGSFAARVDFSTGNDPRAVVIGDIDNDKKPDLLITNYMDNTISLFRNTSTTGIIDAGSIAARVNFTSGMNPCAAAIGDIDGDGRPDIIISNGSENSISIFRNAGITGDIMTGSLLPPISFTAGAFPISVSVGDIDGDGKPDIAVSNLYSNSISLFRNTSISGSITSGSLTGRVDFSTWTYPSSVNICDVDGDSKPDITVLNANSNVVSIFRNIIPQPVPPVINTFSPASGPVGTTITIFGMNFNIIAENNFVWFGAVKATVTNATETQLTVTVPAGATYKPITVTINGLTAFSDTPFNLTFPSTQTIDETTLDVRVDFSTGTGPAGIALGDIDVDGKPDLIVANSQSNVVSVYRNISTSGSISAGSFSSGIDFEAGAFPHDVAIGDIDSDGKPDLVVANFSGNSISVYRNISTTGSISTGSFASKVDFATGSHPENIAIGDIDGDGKPDLAITNNSDDIVSVFRNTGTIGSITTGSFETRKDFNTGTGSGPWGIVIRDLDGDGKPDLSVTNNKSNQLCILRNTSTTGTINLSSFALPVYIPAVNPLGIAVGDIDGDDKPDLVVTNVNFNSISVYRNTSMYGIITFAGNVDFSAGANPYYISLGDIDGNGKPDLAVVNNSGNSVSVYRNTSTSGSVTTSSFAEKADFSTDLAPYGIVIGDLDGDSKPDIIVTNSGGNNVSVLRNALQVPVPPVITSFTPASGAVGATVTINGSGFSTTLSDNFVWFGPVKAAVAAATTSQLTVTVPAGSAYNPITVTVNGMTASSNSSFIVTFSGISEIETSAYSSQIDLPVGMFPSSFAAGDIDEDGKPDLFITNINSSSISVFRNTNTAGSISSGLFGPRVDIMSGTNPQAVVTADIDGDGKLDLVVANGTTSSSVSVYRNNGTTGSVTGGSFDPRVDLPTGDSSIDVAVGDIDGDGKHDLVVTNFNSSFISIYRNISSPGSITTGSFAPVVNFPAEQYLQNIVLADIDGDKKPDLIAPRIYSSAVSVYRNISTMGSITTGSFSEKVDFITGMNPIGVAVGDLDGDGKPEIVTANNMDNDLSVLHNISTYGSITAGSFEPRTDFNTGGISYVTIGDINGDGKPDLIYKNSGNSVNVLQNNCTTGSIGPGSFSSAVEFAADGGATKTLIADFDCDGRPDIAYINAANNQVSILRNKISELSAPEITSFSPTSGPAGTIVTISGSNFSTNGGENIVRFGGIQATILSATTTTLTVVVPAVSSDQTISVTVNGMTTTSGSAFIVTQFLQPPVINSFNPPAGQVGSTVTINGSNFSTTPSNNIVSFGAVKATVNSASSNSLTVVVPAGATFQPITVNVNGLVAYSSRPFNVTFPSSQIIDETTLDSKVDFAAGTHPNIVALGDLDNDGKTDIVVTNTSSNTLSIYRNTSSSGSITEGSFTTRIDLNTGEGPRGIAIGDLDGDNKPDLVVANTESNTLSIYRNSGNPGYINGNSFEPKVDFLTGEKPYNVAIRDLDGDGKPEIVITNYNSGTISIFRNISTIGPFTSASFSAKLDLNAGGNPYEIAVGDIDGDGKPDLAVTNFLENNSVSIFRNTSSPGSITEGSFASRIVLITGSWPSGLAIGDIDGDGKQDLAAVNTWTTTVSIFRNTGNPGSISPSSFAASVNLFPGLTPGGFAFGDINGDGKLDLLVANGEGNSISIFRNMSNPGSIEVSSFAEKVDYSTNRAPTCVVTGDIDGDGKPDIVVANLGASSVSVFRNIISGPVAISSFTPISGPVGSSVIISGSNFSPTPEDNIVMFGNIQATVTAASTDQLTVIVPAGANGQSISVTVNGITASLDDMFYISDNQNIELESSILTLNGDGINEHFVVKNFQSYGSCKFYVYNSRGALVHWNDNFQGEWDVTLHNKRFDTGGYFYVIESEIGTFRGSFSILRE